MEILARVMLERGDAAKAVGYAKAIVKRRPKRGRYRLLLGDAMFKAGNKTGAESEWRQALELDPGDRSAKARLGL